MGGFQNSNKILYRQIVGPILDDLARIIQHDLRSIFSNDSCLALLFEAYESHLLIVIARVAARTGRAATIGDNHTCEPVIFLLKAFQDWTGSHDLNIVLVGA